MTAYEQLKLKNQLCFPVYATSRLITREYQPYLEKLGITYPQYLVFLILWETDRVTVNEIAQKLILQTNTVTPLLKRMEAQGWINRERSGSDERKVVISLTGKGIQMKDAAAEIPSQLASKIVSEGMDLERLTQLRDSLNLLINHLTKVSLQTGISEE